MDLMRNSANLALTGTVCKSRSIAQEQDCAKTFQLLLADDSGVGGQSATTKTSAGRKIVGHGRPSLLLERLTRVAAPARFRFLSRLGLFQGVRAGQESPRGKFT